MCMCIPIKPILIEPWGNVSKTYAPKTDIVSNDIQLEWPIKRSLYFQYATNAVCVKCDHLNSNTSKVIE